MYFHIGFLGYDYVYYNIPQNHVIIIKASVLNSLSPALEAVWQSLDGEALEKAKQQLKQAQKKGFASILDRFDNDVDFTLHSVAGGFDREFLAVEDVLTNSALPNLGRSQEQRTLGVGAYGGGQQAEMARNEAIARLPQGMNGLSVCEFMRNNPPET